MVKLVISEIKLLENFDTLFNKQNEVYFRCLTWLNDDFTTAQYYPNPAIVSKEFLKREPVLRMEKDDLINLENEIKPNGIVLFNLNLDDQKSKIEKLETILEIQNRQQTRIEEDLDKRDKGSYLSSGIISLKEKEIQLQKEKLDITRNIIVSQEEENYATNNTLKKKIATADLIKYQGFDTQVDEQLDLLDRSLTTLRLYEKEEKENLLEKIKAQIAETEYLIRKPLSFLQGVVLGDIKFNYIIQILENDERIREIGSKITQITDFTTSFMEPWFQLRKAEFDVEMQAKLHEAARKAGEGFVDFNPAMYVSPTLYGKGLLNMITGSISFLGKILQANKDEIVCTHYDTIPLSLVKADIVKEGKVEFTLKFIDVKHPQLVEEVKIIEERCVSEIPVEIIPRARIFKTLIPKSIQSPERKPNRFID